MRDRLRTSAPGFVLLALSAPMCLALTYRTQMAGPKKGKLHDASSMVL
ncbi:MAG: hypothetical protein KY468_07870 [Armatimonadetes bacterium]|nr:hypothetical protein [Armatimonadota bacterium]